jgi:hypothetical protein
MVREILVTIAMVWASTAAATVAARQHEGHQTPGGTQQPTADVARCGQAQATVGRLIEAAKVRLELARQANSAAAMRDAIDDFQSVLVDIGAQLAPCAGIQACGSADPHAGHALPAPVARPADPAPADPTQAAPAPSSEPDDADVK